MKPKLRAVITAFVTALCLNATAQQSFFSKAADSMLQYIDKTPLTSGYLYDRAYPLAEIPAFNNNADTSTSEYSMQAYLELYQATYNPQRMTKPEKLNRLTRYLNAQNKIPIQVLDYNYQQIKPTAIQEGLLVHNNGILTNAPGNPNPFISKRLQLSTLLCQVVESPTVQLYLLPHFISRNTGLNVIKIEITGPGFFKTLNGGYDSVTVTFPAMGSHFLTLKTYLSNGSSYTTKNEVVLGDNINNATSRTESPNGTTINPAPACRKENFVGNIPWQGYEDNRPILGKFDLDIYYRLNDPTITCANGTEQPMKKPVILIDGYDPTDKRNTKNLVLYSKFLKFVDDVNFNPPKEEDFVENMRRLGNDVILVDIPTYFYTNTGQVIPLDSNAQHPPPGYTLDDGDLIHGGGDYVERNALTMVSLLLYIQSKIGPNDSITLIGPSMGGQITRYALKYMEDRGIPHRVRLWISQDSNHEGAVVPIGEQFLIAQLAEVMNDLKITRDQLLLSSANKQFVINHYQYNLLNQTENVGGCPGFFDRYRRVKDSIGWPQNCRKISTISGAENGTKLNVPDAAQLALKLSVKLGNINAGTSFWQQLAVLFPVTICDLISSTNCRLLDVSLFTQPAPNQRALVSQIKVPIFRRDINTYVVGENRFTRNQSLEVIQSGFYWAYREIAETVSKMKKPGWVKSMFVTSMPAGYNPLQPTGSTLAYGKGPNPNAYNGYQPKWDDNVLPYNLSCDGYIPFDAYMGPKTFSVLHDSIFYNQAQVLISEIQGIIPNYPKPDKTVFLRKSEPAKNYFCPGETLNFYLETNYGNVAALAPIWTVNSDKLQIVGGQGTPTVSVKYMGGISSEEFAALGSFYISVNAESPCYKLQPLEMISMGAGDIWGGTVTSVASNQGFQLQFGGGYNMSTRANVKIMAGLSFKENNLQNYTLVQNTYNTAMTWNVTPVTYRNRTENQLNITSNIMGEYIYKVRDANRCGTPVNSFTINFSRVLLFRVSPNPAKDEVNISKIIPADFAETNKPATITLSIHDLYSKKQLYIKQYANLGDSFVIPAQNLANGEYVIKIQYGDEVYYEKLMIRK
jgi:Secretion system C-terminal sorting domain